MNAPAPTATPTPTAAQKKQKPLWPLVVLNLSLLGILGFVLAFIFIPAQPQSGTPQAIEAANAIPAFGMESAMHGGSFGSANLKDDIFALNIFASWCKPCEAEHPYLVELASQHNLPLYGIALKDEREKLDAFLKRLGNPYRDIGMDHAGLLPANLGIAGVPTTIIANSDHEILYVHEGPLTRSLIDSKILDIIAGQ